MLNNVEVLKLNLKSTKIEIFETLKIIKTIFKLESLSSFNLAFDDYDINDMEEAKRVYEELFKTIYNLRDLYSL